jgi:hypothetical protein
MSDDGFEHLEALGSEDVEAFGCGSGGRREPGVEVVGEGAGFKFCFVEGGVKGVVAFWGCK